jgi:predicted MFS family arabinose efflux permease
VYLADNRRKSAYTRAPRVPKHGYRTGNGLGVIHVRGGYMRVLAQRQVARTVLPYLIARLPASMILLALLLFIRGSSGSFVTAGGVSAAFALAVAVTAPVLGRLVDGRGQTGVLVVTGVLHPAALLLLLISSSQGAPSPVVLAAAAAAGATLPPMSACMRSLWPALLSDPKDRETAFGLEAIVIEVCELAGPLLVAGLVTAVSPASAVIISGLIAGLGALLFAMSPASRSWAGDLTPRATRRWRGPLAAPGVRWLLAVIATSTAGFAALEVGLAGFATSHGHPGATGTLLALWFTGSLVGGWWYGARRFRLPLAWQLVGLLLAVAAGGLLPLMATSTWTMAGLLLLAGVAVAPAMGVQLAVMAEVAPARSRTEAFTWASTANFLGVGAGTALAGWSVDHGGARLALAVSAALAAVTAVVAYLGRYALGLSRGASAAERRQDAYDLAIFTELAQERDEALAALARAGQRNDELAREVAGLRHQLQEQSLRAAEATPPPAPPAAPAWVPAAPVALARLDASLADLYLLERRRAEVLRDIEQLRAELQDAGRRAEQAGQRTNVTALPRQSAGA